MSIEAAILRTLEECLHVNIPRIERRCVYLSGCMVYVSLVWTLNLLITGLNLKHNWKGL